MGKYLHDAFLLIALGVLMFIITFCARENIDTWQAMWGGAVGSFAILYPFFLRLIVTNHRISILGAQYAQEIKEDMKWGIGRWRF